TLNTNNESLLLIGIISAQSNFEERQSIRETWLKLAYQESVKHYFVIGNDICDIPPEDRVYKESCIEWSVDLKDSSSFSTGEISTAQEQMEMFAGITFLVQHPIVIHSLAISAEFVTVSKTYCKVSLYNSVTRERVVSATFSSHDNNSTLLEKSVEPHVLPKNFEGQLIVELSTDTGMKKILGQTGCWMQWNNAGRLITYQQLVRRMLEKPVAFHYNSCLPISMTFTVYEKESLEKFIMLKNKRKKEFEQENVSLKRKLIQEQEENKDIIFVNVTDVYRNLPRKVLQFFKWAYMNVHFTYLMKTDDDTFINIKEVMKKLQVMKKENQSYLHWWSTFREGWIVQSYGKWREDAYRSTTYPPFPCGAGYVLSKYLVQYLGNDAYDFVYKNFQGEDVSLGIWLAGLNPIRIYNDKNSCIWTCFGKCNPKSCNRAELSVQSMYQAWDSFTKCNNFCGCH
ncbi:hypothetical protein L9F63_005367, partial [Diploptera punctata]